MEQQKHNQEQEQKSKGSELKVDELTREEQQTDVKDELLQEKERERELQQRVREREGSGVATGPLKLKWRDGPPAPFATKGHSVAVSGDMVYCVDGVSGSKVLMFNSRTGGWTALPECPKKFFSIAVVNGQLTAIGGKESDKATNTLLSLPQDKPGIFQQKWIQQLPPMTYCRICPAVATTNTSLILAGGWGPERDKAATVEMMDVGLLCWSTVASLPHPLRQATATICGDRLHVGGGFAPTQFSEAPTKSVVMCEVKDLLQSQSLATGPGLSCSPPVWKEVAQLPVMFSSLVTFQGQLLAVGGSVTNKHEDYSSEVRRYDVTTDSWSVISQMKVKRRSSLAAVLSNNTLMVCGGNTSDGLTASVQLAAL